MSQCERVPSYTVGTDGGEHFIACGVCGSKSYRERDVAERYCGSCRIFHDDVDEARDLEILLRTRELAQEIGSTARAHPHLSGAIIRAVIQHVLVDFQARLLEGVEGPRISG
jgi:hypothetical protein